MEPMVMKGIQLLLSLSILIVLHELGHFIPAKIFKTRVESFFCSSMSNLRCLKRNLEIPFMGSDGYPWGAMSKYRG